MNKFFTKKLSIISFIFVPIIFLWHPNWLGFLGVQPYWPLFWLLPWAMINGSINGLVFGLFLGLILDSLTLDNNFTQVPGLILCGFLFGRIKIKLITHNFLEKNLFIKYLLSKFVPNQLHEVLLEVKFLPFFLISTSHL